MADGSSAGFVSSYSHVRAGRTDVAGFFQRRGAFARFKDLLAERGLLPQWHDYKDRAQGAALRAWCAENDITLTED
jgi:hypothetical protein